jgi:hypothetical protein
MRAYVFPSLLLFHREGADAAISDHHFRAILFPIQEEQAAMPIQFYGEFKVYL